MVVIFVIQIWISTNLSPVSVGPLLRLHRSSYVMFWNQVIHRVLEFVSILCRTNLSFTIYRSATSEKLMLQALCSCGATAGVKSQHPQDEVERVLWGIWDDGLKICGYKLGKTETYLLR